MKPSPVTQGSEGKLVLRGTPHSFCQEKTRMSDKVCLFLSHRKCVVPFLVGLASPYFLQPSSEALEAVVALSPLLSGSLPNSSSIHRRLSGAWSAH